MANEMMRRNDWLDDPFFDNLGRHFFGSFMPTQAQSEALKTDITETDTDYVAKVDMPGIDKEDIKLNYQDNILSISAKKSSFNDHQDKDGNTLMSERSYGAMSRSYRLPNVDDKKIKAAYNDGVLTITLPKLTETQQSPHQITIE
ncbi:Hsp20/alpha crystallin family protein [Lacticaseibacillus jixiensis]|uniref:Hsp20/alpha crystallin family protein n=1 Tax=Lacticaseibacillus jixiensis TaxID=3231926 RepID=UPI0036F22863